MHQYIIIFFKNEKGRNTVIRYMEKYFGNDGLTFTHSLRTDTEQEMIMLKTPSGDNFAGTIKKFRKRGICGYMAITRPDDYLYPSKSKAALELAVEMVRLLGSLFGH